MSDNPFIEVNDEEFKIVLLKAIKLIEGALNSGLSPLDIVRSLPVLNAIGLRFFCLVNKTKIDVAVNTLGEATMKTYYWAYGDKENEPNAES